MFTNNKKYTIDDDIKIFLKEYKGNFENFWENHNKKSFLVKAMYSSSCKMVAIAFNLIASEGPVVVYSNYVKMEGLEIFRIYLEYMGFSHYGFFFNLAGININTFHLGL